MTVWPHCKPSIDWKQRSPLADNPRNTSLNCDSTTFNRLKNPDYYLWSSDNVTRLCTSDCTAAIESWNETVTTACADDTIEYMGKAVPAETIAGRYVQGASLVCLTNSTGDSCIIASQNWVGSDLIYNSDGKQAAYRRLRSSLIWAFRKYRR